MLEKTKLDKILPRLVKRGDDQVKSFAQKLLDNATNTSKHKPAAGKAGQIQQSNGAFSGSVPDTKSIKREAPDDDKKPLESLPKAAKITKTVKLGTGQESSVKADAKVAIKTAGSDSSAVKIKTNHITAKPTGFFTGLKSASKKPGTSVKSEAGKTR